MKSRKILIMTALVIVLSLVVVGCSGEGQGGQDDQATVYIGETPYPQEWFVASIVSHVAEELGYATEMVEGDIGFMFLGLAQGDIDVYPDAWLPTLHGTYMDRYEDEIELAGTIYEEPDMGWAVPSYVDVDSIEDLRGRADEFDNRIIGIEPSAGMMVTSLETLEAYDLEDDYELIESSTPAMLGELDKAIQNEEAIVFLAWRPHTMFTNYDIKVLEDPESIWELDDVLSAVNPGLEEKAPEVYEFLQNFNISIEELEEMIDEMESNDRDVAEIAAEWIEENREEVDAMIGQ